MRNIVSTWYIYTKLDVLYIIYSIVRWVKSGHLGIFRHPNVYGLGIEAGRFIL